MVQHEGGRWDVGIEDNAVYLERVSESDETLFDDLLAPDEARALAGGLSKYADKVDESEDSDASDEDSDASEASDKSEDSKVSDESDESEDSDASDEESDESEDSDKSS